MQTLNKTEPSQLRSSLRGINIPQDVKYAPENMNRGFRGKKGKERLERWLSR